MTEKIDHGENAPASPPKTRRSRRLNSMRPQFLSVQTNEPATYGEFHPRPAKSALEAAREPYEPPYESPEMQIGQRAEHPEYDTGHAVPRPIDVEGEEAA